MEAFNSYLASLDYIVLTKFFGRKDRINYKISELISFKSTIFTVVRKVLARFLVVSLRVRRI